MQSKASGLILYLRRHGREDQIQKSIALAFEAWVAVTSS
jgi:hypothetical protein